MNLRTRISLACLVAMSGSAQAADGDPDPTFSSDGRATVTWPYSTSRVRVAAAADGSIFHATTEAIDNGAETDLDFAVSKFRSNGQLDLTFGTQGQRSVGFDVIPDGDDSLLGVFPLASGRLLLAGTVDLDPESFTYAAPGLLRLTASGDIDASFGENGRVVVPETPWVPNDDVDLNTVLRQPDGKLVFTGHCFNCGGISLVIAVRLTESGEIDPSFGDAGWVGIEVASSVQAYASGIDAWGRIVIAGSMEPEDDFHDRPWLARLTPDGSLDPEFGNGSGMSFLSQVPHLNNDWFVRAIAIDRDGSIVLALGNGAGAIVRANADGSLDTTFAAGGFLNMEREDGTDMRAVAIRSDHRIMVAGTINHTGGGYDHLIGRLLRDGTLDPDFDGNGVIRIDMVEGETDSGRDIVLSAGRPVIAGYGGADLNVSTLVRLQSDLIFADGCGD
jgi:uncharacterized delta-60 repeat protein